MSVVEQVFVFVFVFCLFFVCVLYFCNSLKYFQERDSNILGSFKSPEKSS